MKLEPGLGASYAIRPGNGVGLFYSSRTHTGAVMPHGWSNLLGGGVTVGMEWISTVILR